MPSVDDTRLTLERYAAAWLKGDLPTLTAIYGDDIVFNYLGRHGLAGRHEGKPRTLAALAEFTRRTGRRLKSDTPSTSAVGTAVRAVLSDPRYRVAAQRIQASMAKSSGMEGLTQVIDTCRTSGPGRS